MAYESYDVYIANIAPNPENEYFKDAFNELVDRDFKLSTSYYEIEKWNTSTEAWDNIDVRINKVTNNKNENKSKLLGDFRVLYFNGVQGASVGDKFRIDSEIWLTIDTQHTKTMVYSATIRRSNHTLKWINTEAKEINEYSIVDYNRSNLLGISSDDRYLAVGDNQYMVALPDNSETDKLIRDKRFIIDSLAYKITKIERVIKTGLCILTLKEDQIQPEYDDTTNGIANAFGYPVYTLTIIIDTFDMSISDTKTLEVEVKKDGDIVTDKTVLYSSSDTDVCTVDSSGEVTAIANGSCVITAYISGNSTVSDTASFEIKASPDANYSEGFVGDDNIPKEQTKSYFIYRYLNGVDTGDTYTFTIVGSGATVSVVDGNNVDITAGDSTGSFVLRATNNVTSSITNKTITITELW
jgi:hypothetical protein